MGALDFTIILLYVGIMIIAGFIGMRKAKSNDDYLVSGRSLPVPIFVACIATVVIGGGATFGQATQGYNFGISAMWMVTMFGVGVLALGFLLSTKLSNLRILSLGEMMQLRYNDKARLISSVISTFYVIMVSVTNTISLGACIQTIFGWSLSSSIIFISSICLLYTLLGGMISINITDTIQFILMTISIFFILLPLGLSKVGGFSGMQEVLPDSYFDPFAVGGTRIFSWFVLYTLGLMIGQDIWQRVFTAKNAKVARTGTILGGLYTILWAAAITIIGMVAMVLLPNITPQNALSEVTIAALPTGLIGLVFAGIMSAFMSTISGTVIASSTMIVNDILPVKNKSLKLTRGVVICNGIIVMLIAVIIGDVLTALDIAYALVSGSIFVPVIAAFFWKRANWQGAIASMVASSIVIVIALIICGTTSTTPILLGVTVSAVTLVIVSLITKPTAKKQADEWEKKTAPAKNAFNE